MQPPSIPLIDVTSRLFPVRAEMASAGRANVVSVTPEVTAMLEGNCVAAQGISGGKDSVACAIAVDAYLNKIGHKGPRVLIHADLGEIEWSTSLLACQKLAAHLGWELMVVKRKAGGMMERWEGRWANNVARYQDLSCVKLILPWSTPSLRFCTSELKVDVIASHLKKRFPGHNILNITGVRREESANRARMPVSYPIPKLQRKGLLGVGWNAIIEWPVEDVIHVIVGAGLELHEAYTKFGLSRLSCCFCIMSSLADMQASATCPDNLAAYLRLVELEAKSSFGFQGNRWLADVAPHLLPPELQQRIEHSKHVAAQRMAIEAELPKHLMFTKGWPAVMPSREEAALIASVRGRVSDLLQLGATHLTEQSVMDRYAELMAKAAA